MTSFGRYGIIKGKPLERDYRRMRLMGYVEIALAGIIWASTGPIIRALKADGFTSWDVVLGRAFFSVTFLGLWLLVKRLTQKGADTSESGPAAIPTDLKEGLPTFAVLGFIGVVLSQSSYFFALTQVSVAVAVTLNYTAPFFVLILSYMLYKEPITKVKGLALLGALLGVALTSGFVGTGSIGIKGSLLGVLAGLLSGFSYGMQTIVYKSVGRKHGPITLNFWMMLTGALQLTLLLALVTGKLPTVFSRMATASPKAWILMTLIGIGPGTAAFVLFADGINKVEATRGSIVAMSEPVAACLLGYLVLDEKLTWLQLAGVVLVIGSIMGISITKAPEIVGSKTGIPERNRQVDQNV